MFRRHPAANRNSRGATRERRARLTRLARTVATHDPLQASEAPTAEFERTWKLSVKQRVILIVAGAGLWVAGIEARLVHLQVLLKDEYTAIARSQQKAEIPLEAGRGDITDRKGRLLAYSVEAEAITADPSLIKDPKGTVGALCQALADCTPKERAMLTERLAADRRFAWVRRPKDATPEQISKVRALGLTGILFANDNRRYHPLLETAAHVIGSVGADNEGLAGIEYSFNKIISGIDGRATAEVDRNRQRLRTRVERAPVPGASLVLTIDATLQHIAERELAAGVKAHRAAGGTAVIMDPNTGEVLALANYPTFNPNAANLASEDDRRNRALQDVYEPGSTFKIVTASAAIEEGVLGLGDLIDTSPGSIVIGRRKPIRDTHSYGLLTFEDVIVKSSNVGAIKAGLRVGPERLARYVQRFGFGQTLAPQLAGESRGIWSSADLNDSRLASVSMGYEIGVTPLQMAAAVSAVANGGKLLEPHFVQSVIRAGKEERIAPRVLRQAISPVTAATVTTMMEGVVERGTATSARLPGYGVAGKTGTAKKAVPGGYSNSDYNASFVGFLPSRAPRFTILVVVDTPRGSYYGGVVAAPIFQKIAAGAVQYAGLAPTAEGQPRMIMQPSPPEPYVRPAIANRTPILTPVGSPIDGPALMPDLVGLPAREAVRQLMAFGLTPRLKGTGFVVSQYPLAGAALASGAVGTLELKRLVVSSDGGNEP